MKSTVAPTPTWTKGSRNNTWEGVLQRQDTAGRKAAEKMHRYTLEFYDPSLEQAFTRHTAKYRKKQGLRVFVLGVPFLTSM